MGIFGAFSTPKVLFSTIVMGWQMRDEISSFLAYSSLSLGLVITRNKQEREDVRCQLCDRVMDDLLGSLEDIEDIPCNAICFGKKRCVDICEGLKDVQENAQEFPCIAVGYCPHHNDGHAVELGGHELDGVPECQMTKFQCGPSSHCQRVIKGLRFRCELKPGIKRWVRMRRHVLGSAVAMASAMMTWPYCSEENGAGSQFCIAEPRGNAYVAHLITMFLVLVVGVYRSLKALFTPGSDDDAHYLTFWLVVVVLSSIEGYVRVILSRNFPPYFHVKCLLITWLLFNDGAEKIYRHLLHDCKYILDVLRLSKGHMSARQIQTFNKNGFLETIDKNTPSNCFAKYYDPSLKVCSLNTSRRYYTGWSCHLDDLTELYSHVNANQNTLRSSFDKYDWWSDLEESLLDWKSFNPRYLRITLLSADNLPDFGKHKVTDPYVVFTLRQPHAPMTSGQNGNRTLGQLLLQNTIRKIRSTTKFNTLSPVWNETFEIRLSGCNLNKSTGYYHNRIIDQDTLDITFYSEDGRYISLIIRSAILLLTVLLPFLLFVAFSDFPYITTPQYLEYLEVVLDNKNGTLFFVMCDIGQKMDARITSFMRMKDGRIATVPIVSFLCVILFLKLLQRWWQRNAEKDDLIGQIRIDLKDLIDQKEKLLTRRSLILPRRRRNDIGVGTQQRGKGQVKQEENEKNRGTATFAVRLLE